MKNKGLILAMVLLAALLAGITWGLNRNNQNYPNFTSMSNNELGVSLLYDTLQHLQYPVTTLHLPVNDALSFNDVVFIIQPVRPRVCHCMTEDILDWVRLGGRLFFLENRANTVMDNALESEPYQRIDNLRRYRVGMGEVITGRADNITNINLMCNPSYGETIANILTAWSPVQIHFAEYYHGFQRTEGIFGQLPVGIRMVTFQIFITAAVLMWHLGKRFGKPIQFYEEVERDENEQVIVLARLYKQADRRKV